MRIGDELLLSSPFRGRGWAKKSKVKIRRFHLAVKKRLEVNKKGLGEEGLTLDFFFGRGDLKSSVFDLPNLISVILI